MQGLGRVSGAELRGNEWSTGLNASSQQRISRKRYHHTSHTSSSAGSTSNPTLFRARRWLSTSSPAQSQELLHWCANLLRNNDRAIKCNNGTIRLSRRADRSDIWWSDSDISLDDVLQTTAEGHQIHPSPPLLPVNYPLGFRDPSNNPDFTFAPLGKGFLPRAFSFRLKPSSIALSSISWNGCG
jgi:hypothetical protein